METTQATATSKKTPALVLTARVSLLTIDMTDILDPNKFLGEPCRKCGECLRYEVGKRCVKCRRERDRQRGSNPDRQAKRRVYGKTYTRNHPEKIKQNTKRQEARRRETGYYKAYYSQEEARRSHQASNRRRKSQIRAVSIPYSGKELIERFTLFDNACAYCGSTGQLTIDHFVAIARGGKDALINIVPACKSCNSSKNDSLAWDWYERQEFFDWYLWNVISENTERV